MRRGMIWSQLFKRDAERFNGRIYTTGSNWVFADAVPKGYALSDVEKIKFKRVDASGKEIILIKRKGAQCHNIEKASNYPKDSDECWFVPFTLCQKCEHYHKARKGANYPHCLWEKERLGGAKGMVEEFGKIMGQVNEQMKEIMG